MVIITLGGNNGDNGPNPVTYYISKDNLDPSEIILSMVNEKEIS